MGATEADLGDLYRLLATGIISTGTFLLSSATTLAALLYTLAQDAAGSR